ncbi:hypothetical protein EUTSA_v10029361mg [Eutrema salsugineum]|uniref:S-protein homolog n=1 Tax=Eutrema salsugineum TaxID=72664 RepID=V4L4K8_EUTSA|nr:hypothetical protein EUTSA_v10029361mg [Eutrema salsugineum]
MNNCCLIFLLIIILFVRSSEAKCGKNAVVFKNKLASSRSILEVHCKSKYDDLGVHFVKFNAHAYTFRFRDNVFIRTKWDCLIRKGRKMEYIDFRAYTGGFVRRCGASYTWIAKDDGVYLSKNGKPEICISISPI